MKLERASNIAIIAVSIVASVVLVKNSFFDKPRRANPLAAVEALKGKTIELDSSAKLSEPGVNKVLLSLSTQCHFCDESMPFYRKLTELRTQGADFRLLAALPQQGQEARAYLQGHEISVDAVIHSSPVAKAGVNGTPAVILFNEAGRVEKVWIGLLSESRQQEVLARIRGKERNQ